MLCNLVLTVFPIYPEGLASFTEHTLQFSRLITPPQDLNQESLEKWRLCNWGCKSEALAVSCEHLADCLVLRFSVEDKIPFRVLQQLSATFPRVAFAISYAALEGRRGRLVLLDGREELTEYNRVTPDRVSFFVDTHDLWVAWIRNNDYATPRKEICLTRRLKESVVIRTTDNVIVLTLKEISGDRARITISSNTGADVWRQEIDRLRYWPHEG